MLPPKNLGRHADLACRADDSDRIRRIGGDIEDVGTDRLDGAKDRSEVAQARRIGFVIDDLKARRLCVCPRAIGGVLGEF